jgi:hypothetical protein
MSKKPPEKPEKPPRKPPTGAQAAMRLKKEWGEFKWGKK